MPQRHAGHFCAVSRASGCGLCCRGEGSFSYSVASLQRSGPRRPRWAAWVFNPARLASVAPGPSTGLELSSPPAAGTPAASAAAGAIHDASEPTSASSTAAAVIDDAIEPVTSDSEPERDVPMLRPTSKRAVKPVRTSAQSASIKAARPKRKVKAKPACSTHALHDLLPIHDGGNDDKHDDGEAAAPATRACANCRAVARANATPKPKIKSRAKGKARGKARRYLSHADALVEATLRREARRVVQRMAPEELSGRFGVCTCGYPMRPVCIHTSLSVLLSCSALPGCRGMHVPGALAWRKMPQLCHKNKPSSCVCYLEDNTFIPT